MVADEAALAADLGQKVEKLQEALREQGEQHRAEIGKATEDLRDLRKLVADLEAQTARNFVVGHGSGADFFTRRVEWTITGFSAKLREKAKGESLWSPKFRAAGLDGLHLEFFPQGREKTVFDGFCSLFLWCPSGAKVRYRLWVGNFLRAPDEDEYTGRIGHGHSNFCPVAPEINRETDSIVVGVDLLEVRMQADPTSGGVRLVSTSLEALVAREVQVVQNRSVERVVWKIPRISQHLKQLPKGASMWSQLFTAAGIREILLEFYPNGSTNTTKEGFCAFYIRCPEGVSIIVTLFVGNTKKGPIKTTFDSVTGKGLPDFCAIQPEIGPDNSIEVGIELQNQPSRLLQLES